MSSHRPHPLVDRSEFAGFRFPPDVIAVAVRWYLRYRLSHRDVESCSPSAASWSTKSACTAGCSASPGGSSTPPGPGRHSLGNRWFVDGTYIKIGGRWCYLYRAVDQFGQVIDVYLSADATRGLKRQRCARVLVAGHAFVQNLRRGHYELGTEVPANRRVAVAFSQLARVI